MPRKRPHPEDWVDPSGLLLLQRWAQNGLSQTEIVKEMHRVRGTELSERTLRRWIKNYPTTIGRALQNGIEASLAAVENALFQKAMSGDNAAMIFYLKNKDPQHWSEHPELRGVSGKVVFIDDIPATQPPKPAADKPAGEAEQPDHS